MFLKSHLFYSVNSNYILNVLETAKFEFCLRIHALAECTMNSKFWILHSAPAASCSIQNFSFIVRSVRACICKQNTHNSLQPLIVKDRNNTN